MAIYDHKYGELPYFRVFRAWGGKEYQEYVRIKRNRDAAYRKAVEIDEKLAQRQRAYFTRQAYTIEYHLRKDGRIRGLRRVTVNRKGRAPTDVLELRINIPWEEKIHRTTLSIDIHGLENCFLMAVNKICEWYGLDKNSDVRKAMLNSMPLYLQTSPPEKPARAPRKKVKEAVSAIAEPEESLEPEAAKSSTESKQTDQDSSVDKAAKDSDVQDKPEGGTLKRAQDELSQFKDGLFRAIKKFRES
ncbi:MAG: hypothetical protein H6999_06930 [Hahellaceae bacterium]|nr:hypothetical protein [Hahellaceae bacterium]